MSFLENEIRAKIQHYCAYQERCHSEVKTKLYALGCYTDTVNDFITELIQTGFLNEQRFATAFAGGKFRTMKWGKIKIKIALKQKNVSDNCIKSALAEIEEDDYLNCIERLIISKSMNRNNKIEEQKLIKWLMGKGFEYDLIIKTIQKLEKA